MDEAKAVCVTNLTELRREAQANYERSLEIHRTASIERSIALIAFGIIQSAIETKKTHVRLEEAIDATQKKRSPISENTG